MKFDIDNPVFRNSFYYDQILEFFLKHQKYLKRSILEKLFSQLKCILMNFVD